MVDGRRVGVNYILLILALSPDEVLVEFRGGVELLGEKTGLALFGFGILLSSGQVEDQVGDDEGLCRFVKPGHILLAEAGEIDGVNLFGSNYGVSDTS